MKKLLFLILLISLSCKTDKQQKTEIVSEKTSEKITEEIKYVTAKSGLIYRDKPKGERLGKFNFNSKLSITEHTKIFQEIKNNGKTIKGEWLGTKINGKTVYVFGGFLSDTKHEYPKINFEQAKKQLQNGIWVSEEFKQILNETKSVTQAYDLSEFYSNIIFSENESGYDKFMVFCDKYFQEATPFEIDEDLNAGWHNKTDFKIIYIHNNSLIIEKDNKSYNFSKTPKNMEEKSANHEIFKGTQSYLNNWFSGTYIFSTENTKQEVTIHKSGHYFYTWFPDNKKGAFDIVELNNNYYQVEKIENSTYFLIEIEPLQDADAPIILTSKKATLTKISD